MTTAPPSRSEESKIDVDAIFGGTGFRSPVLVVSPHAVLSVGNVLATQRSVVVLTIFAGAPETATVLTRWDRDCGFHPGDDVIGARRAEDLQALAMLTASPVWLDYLEEQYAADARPSVDRIARAIRDEVTSAGARTVLQPLGLIHRDHQLLAAASLQARGALVGVDWFVYADLPYHYMVGGRRSTTRALALLAEKRVSAQAIRGSAASELKKSAIECDPSQARGLERGLLRRGTRLAQRPEQFWRLDPRESAALP